MKLGIILALTFATLAGCMTPEQAETARTESSETVAQLEADLARMQQQLADAQAAGDPTAIERAEKSLALMERIVDHARRGDEILQASINPDGSINVEAVAQQTAPYLPFPWNVVIVVGAGLAGRVLAERQIRAIRTAQQQAEADRDSIIKGIDAARASDPSLKAAMKAQEGTILKHYTDTAHDRVEKLATT